MRFESVWAVYFSACGSTRRVLRRMAEAAGEALALSVRELDYTLPPAREQNYAFGEGDLIFWGSPTYAGRLPNVLLPFLRGHFTGGSAAAVAVVLYGNRGYDDALKELCEVLSGNGFARRLRRQWWASMPLRRRWPMAGRMPRILPRRRPLPGTRRIRCGNGNGPFRQRCPAGSRLGPTTPRWDWMGNQRAF